MEKEKINLKEKTLCVIDNGLFISFAQRLSREFGRVLYFTEWRSAFPSKKSVYCGVGLDGIERVNNLFDIIDEVDVFFFPDIYDGDLQLHLESLGKKVFGARNGDELEIMRDAAKEHFKELGLPVSKYEVVTGFDKLRELLKKVDDKYIKINSYRADFETFHHVTYRLTEPLLDEIEKKLGAMKFDYQFVVEDAISGGDIVEAGSDLYSIDGEFPKKIISGYEIKDLGYIAKAKEYSLISPLITNFNKVIAPTLKEYRYRNFFSTEIRVGKDKKSYMIDFCARCGSPPSEIYQEMIKNLGEIIWYGSQGIMVEPVFEAQYGIEIMIHSQWANENWQAVYYPKDIERWVKLRNACKIKDTFYVIPQENGLPEIGAVVAIGNSIEECIKKVKGYAEQIEGYDIDIKMGSIEDMKEVVKKGEKLNIYL